MSHIKLITAGQPSPSRPLSMDTSLEETAQAPNPLFPLYTLLLQEKIQETAGRVDKALIRMMPFDQKGDREQRPVVLTGKNKIEEVGSIFRGMCSYEVIPLDRELLRVGLKLNTSFRDLENSKSLTQQCKHLQFQIPSFHESRAYQSELLHEAKQYYSDRKREDVDRKHSPLPSLQQALRNISHAPIEMSAEELFATTQLSEIPPNADLLRVEEHLIRLILNDNKAFCLIEKPKQYSSKQFLLQHMTLLKELGINTIFIQMLNYETSFDLLLEYNRSSKAAHLPPLIALHLEKINSSQRINEKISIKAVIEAAHKEGIDIIAIGSNGSDESALQNTISANYKALDIINRHSQEANGSYIIWTELANAQVAQTEEMAEEIPAGLAASLSTAIIECEDTFSMQGHTQVEMGAIEGTDSAHIKIKRDLYQRRDAFSKAEKMALDLLLTLKEGRYRQDPLIKGKMKYLFENLRKQPPTSPLLTAEISREFYCLFNSNPWPCPSRQPLRDLIDRNLTERLCSEFSLNKQKLQFNPERIAGLLTGGACSSLVMLLASNIATLSKAWDFTSDTELLRFSLNNIGDDIEQLSIQSALNTIAFKDKSKILHKTKIASIASFFGFQAQPIGDMISIADSSCLDSFKEKYRNIQKNGLYFIRCIQPEDNEKGESYGHSTLMIKRKDATYFYDPNHGIIKLENKVAAESLFDKLLLSHLQFNIPLMNIYHLKPTANKKLLLPTALIEHRKKNIHVEIDTLPLDVQHVLLCCAAHSEKFFLQSSTISMIKDLPSRLVLEILNNPESLNHLDESGTSLELLKNNSLSIQQRIAMIQHAQKFYRDKKGLRPQETISSARPSKDSSAAYQPKRRRQDDPADQQPAQANDDGAV